MEFPTIEAVEASMEFSEHGLKLANDFVAKSYEPLAKHPYLYHYREHKGVTESIVTKGKFWATHAAHMSDTKELLYGADIVRSVLDEFLVMYPDAPWPVTQFIDMAKQHANPYNNELSDAVDPFFVCFSERGDIESQWEGYAGNSTGYCIEFAVAEPFTNPNSTESYALSAANIQFLKVIYDVKEQRRLVFEAVMDFANMVIDHLNRYGMGAWHSGMSASIGLYYILIYYVMCFKSPDLIDEQEWRCVYGMSNYKRRDLEVLKRELRGRESPYVEMPLISANGPLIVKSIAKGKACTEGDINFR